MGAAAAHIWQLIPEPPSTIAVAVPPDRRIDAPRGVRVVRTIIDRAERTERFGLPVTCLVRTARAHKIAIEIDGFAYHSDRARYQQDRNRQNLLVLDGWTVLRFTWEDITDRPGQVLAAILAVLDAAA